MMKTLKIPLHKHGKNLGITLPKSYIEEAGLIEGDHVLVNLRAGATEIEITAEELTIDQLLSTFEPDDYSHEELIRGEVGKEIIRE
jgi:antitoxin component of MazEF toxin-antitoxin module